MEVVTTHIVICDDEKNVRAYIRKLIEERDGKFEITEYASGEELLRAFGGAQRHSIDLLFLDIAMGDIDGMGVAKKIRQVQADKDRAAWGSLPLIIFVTGYSNYMPDAFSVNAFQFIVKPIKEADFENVFIQATQEYNRLMKRRAKKKKEIIIRDGANTQIVKANDILYIESDNHKVLFYLQNTQLDYYGKISDFEQELQTDFFRIHKGYLVNLKYIECYDRSCVTLRGGRQLAISKYKYQDFLKAYMRYLTEN